jgi:poly-gamma-glutamate capsule biosynthesis protein CapA/YwtB (metallophosphatase superfamily)
VKVDRVRLFLCGDVMTGRGIDQILAHPGDPTLHEDYIRDARAYVALAERTSGTIARGVQDAYIWGDALEELETVAPDVRIVNLETAVTTRDEPWIGKGVHYRMHPANVSVLRAGGIDCCVLANNHVIDWGRGGLLETLEVVRPVSHTCGAGRDREEASAPAVIDVDGGRRVLVFGAGSVSSGIPEDWAASNHRPGVRLVREGSEADARALISEIARHRRLGDVVVVSIHWGGNWGHDIPPAQRAFAHRLVESGAVDVVHGHSSHHVKAFEVHAGKLVLYGCGDFLTDYEGIGGHARFRSDLSLMFFPLLDASSGDLLELRLTPMRTVRFALRSAQGSDRNWLLTTMQTLCEPHGVHIVPTPTGPFHARWS